MAGDDDCSHQFTDIEGDCSRDNGEVSVVKDEISENGGDLKQSLKGKPPRHLSFVRHSMSTAALGSPTDLVVNTYFCNLMQLCQMLCVT